jgi:putative Ca2+/H+ antiporter (TMEM165/GDT1 family)
MTLFSPFLVSFGALALSEIGDKTQLLAMTLAVRTRRPLCVLGGILLATLINNAAAAALGQWAGGMFTPEMLRWISGLGLLAMAAWMLLPEKEGGKEPAPRDQLGAMGAAFVLFLLAELGDKTQIATLTLAARFNNFAQVVAGTTLGMMLVNIPAVYLGDKITENVPARMLHIVAAVVYAGFGLFTLFGPR